MPETTIVKDGGWGWIIVFSGFVCHVLVDGVVLSSGVLLPMFSEYFESTKSKLSVIGSLLTGTYMCSAPLVSFLIIKFGCRRVTIAGSIIAASGFLLASFSPNIDFLIIAYGFIGGLGFGMIYLPPTVCVSQYFIHKQPIATGIVLCGTGVGSVIFAYLLNELVKTYDWKNILFIMAGITLNGAVCGMLMRPMARTKNVSHQTANTLDNDGARAHINKKQVTGNLDPKTLETEIPQNYNKCTQGKTWLPSLNIVWLKIVRLIKDIGGNVSKTKAMWNTSLFLLCVGNMFGFMGYMIQMTYIVDRALTLHVLSNKAAFLLSITGITNTVFRVLGGIFVSCRKVNAVVLTDVALITGTIVVGLHPFCNTYPMLAVSAALFGMCVGIYMSVSPVILYELFGLEMFSYTYGIVTLFRGIGSVSGPPLAGLVFDNSGNYDGVFFCGGGMFLLSALFHLMLHIPCVSKMSTYEVTL